MMRIYAKSMYTRNERNEDGGTAMFSDVEIMVVIYLCQEVDEDEYDQMLD